MILTRNFNTFISKIELEGRLQVIDAANILKHTKKVKIRYIETISRHYWIVFKNAEVFSSITGWRPANRY